MKERAFAVVARGWPTAVTRRRVVAALALGLPAIAPATVEGAKRCKRRLAPCTKKSRCCGKRSVCGTSHGEGSNTCCGGKGATCGSDLTCCIAFLCEAGRCLPPPPE